MPSTPHMARKARQLGLVCVLLLLGIAASAQTFEINPQKSPPTAKSGKKSKKAPGKAGKAPAKAGKPAPPAAHNPGGGLGWGAGIEVARNARAAQQALKKKNYPEAVQFAGRAANAAPQNTELWFLLGYSCRLAGRYQASVDAYQRGLKNEPSSVHGLSGLAQTYARMGRIAEANDLLQRVLAANPSSVVDLQLAGEIALSTDPQKAVDLLKRAESLQASPRSELMLARAFQHLKQPDASQRYLEEAKARAPNDPEVLRAVAGFYRDSGKYDQAIATLQKVQKVGGKGARGVLSELAYTYQLAGKKKKAAELYTEAANKSPEDVNLQLSAAQAVVNAGEVDRAEGFLKRAEASNPNHYRLHALRGDIATLQGREKDAVHEYQLALQNLPPGGPQEGPLYPVSLHLNLYQAYRATDQNTESEQELAAAQSQLAQVSTVSDSSKPEFLRLRSLIESALNQMDAAERDIKEALSLAPDSINIKLNYANLLWKLKRNQDAHKLYAEVLQQDPVNHAAITAMGYLSRDMNEPKAAEEFFTKLVKLYPNDYVGYLALGDLYTAHREFDKAQASYEKARSLEPGKPAIYSGAVNASLEAHKLPLAKQWLDRAAEKASINDNPEVMRERERYLTWTGKYEESAALGYQVIQKLPDDKEAPVYLAYDLLFLQRFNDAEQIVNKYKPILPKDKDLRLIAGYIHTHSGQSEEAVKDFTEALEIDPKVPTAYMNRGFVLNDMGQGSKAVADFNEALKLRPDYGQAHLGLAYANLQLHRSRAALAEVNAAAKQLGENKATHMGRGEAYRQEVLLRQAEVEYREAMKLAPTDPQIHLALADVLYRLHRYPEAIDVLQATVPLTPDNTPVYAQMAKCYAQLGRRDDALKAIASAEQPGVKAKILLATGEALMILGDEQGAMTRYERALESDDSERLETRLALARLFAQQGKRDEAKQQVTYGLAEARVGEADPVTAETLLETAEVLMSIQEFDLAKLYFERAHAAGADDAAVGVGLANAYVALGQTASAEQTLRAARSSGASDENYEYLIAMANVYRQQHDNTLALSSLARANRIVLNNESAERAEMALAAEEGKQITPNLSVLSEASVDPILDDINLYTTDARIRNITDPSLLPPPRSSIQTIGDARYRVHLTGWPTISGLVEERNARGKFSFPDELLIQNRDTYDTVFNTAVNPVLHLGGETIVFSPGVQFTIRRDTLAPLNMNQNLFRQFLGLYTSAFKNWVSISGNVAHEAGPFTERNLSSRDLRANLEFTVGRPWGRTSLISGYSARDVLFHPEVREYFATSMYAGIQRKIGETAKLSVFAQYLRSWRVQDLNYATGQALVPAFRFEYRPGARWEVEAAGTWSQGKGYHFYDNVNNEFMVSYVKPIQRSLNDGMGNVPVHYPLRFSFGLQQQTFYNFSGSNSTIVLPVVRLSVF